MGLTNLALSLVQSYNQLCITYSSSDFWQQRVSAPKVKKMHLFLHCVVLCIQKFCNVLAPRFTTVHGQTTLLRRKRLNNMAGLNTSGYQTLKNSELCYGIEVFFN